MREVFADEAGFFCRSALLTVGTALPEAALIWNEFEPSQNDFSMGTGTRRKFLIHRRAAAPAAAARLRSRPGCPEGTKPARPARAVSKICRAGSCRNLKKDENQLKCDPL